MALWHSNKDEKPGILGIAGVTAVNIMGIIFTNAGNTIILLRQSYFQHQDNYHHNHKLPLSWLSNASNKIIHKIIHKRRHFCAHRDLQSVAPVVVPQPVAVFHPIRACVADGTHPQPAPKEEK